MSTPELIALLAGVAALIVAGIAWYRSGQPLTLQGVTETLEASRPLAEQIREVAEVVVSGMQQLKETGKIETGDEAFARAMKHLHAWFPYVEPWRLVPFIEDAYRGVRLGTELMRADELRSGQPDRLRVVDQHGVPKPTAEDTILDEWQRQQAASGFDPDTGAEIPLG